MKKGLFVVVTLLLGLMLVGTIYEAIGERRDRERLPRVGEAVDIGGRTLNLFCSGTGTPTVIFDAGAGGSGYSWADLQPQVAQLTRACWYDRAGEGWSDPGPFPRTSAAIARDLHALLHQAQVDPPYVLVGHSFGGLNARVYTGLYPQDVAGLVLIESAHEEEPARAPTAFVGPKPPRWLWHPLHLLFMGAARVGLLRFLGPQADLAPPAERTRMQIVQALHSRPIAVATANSVGLTNSESYAEARKAGSLGDRPLLVLTRGQPFGHDPSPEVEGQLTAWFETWVHELQAGLAKLSTRGRQIIVTQAGHDIPNEAPDVVLTAVRLVVHEVRGRIGQK